MSRNRSELELLWSGWALKKYWWGRHTLDRIRRSLVNPRNKMQKIKSTLPNYLPALDCWRTDTNLDRHRIRCSLDIQTPHSSTAEMDTKSNFKHLRCVRLAKSEKKFMTTSIICNASRHSCPFSDIYLKNGWSNNPIFRHTWISFEDVLFFFSDSE